MLKAILLAPVALIALIVLAILSLPSMVIALGFLVTGDEDGYMWWNEHSPLISTLDWLDQRNNA